MPHGPYKCTLVEDDNTDDNDDDNDDAAPVVTNERQVPNKKRKRQGGRPPPELDFWKQAEKWLGVLIGKYGPEFTDERWRE